MWSLHNLNLKNELNLKKQQRNLVGVYVYRRKQVGDGLWLLLLFYMYIWGLSNFRAEKEIAQIPWDLIDIFVFLNHKDWD